MSYTLTNYLDSVFDDFWGNRSSQSRLLSTTPALNIEEYDDRFEITVTTPGIDPNKIHIEVSDNTLTISYDHEDTNTEEKEGKTVRREYSHYSFSRSVRLPRTVDSTKIKAKSKNGILTIIIHKSPETQPQKIAIEHSEE